MSASTLYHTRYNKACHSKQSFHIRIDNNIPFIQITFKFFIYTNNQTGIIYQNINVSPFTR